MTLNLLGWIVILFGGAFIVSVVKEEYENYKKNKKIEWSKIFAILLLAYVLYNIQMGV